MGGGNGACVFRSPQPPTPQRSIAGRERRRTHRLTSVTHPCQTRHIRSSSFMALWTGGETNSKRRKDGCGSGCGCGCVIVDDDDVDGDGDGGGDGCTRLGRFVTDRLPVWWLGWVG